MGDLLRQLSRLQLAQLGREYMLCSQFNSRTGYAALRMNHGDESYKDVAIDNWMAASPVYTRRMQEAMGFSGGTDVATIFKGLQLECGFTHQYFDVHFEVQSPTEGRFWLHSCGALLETAPRGEDAVRVMCHDIEDPTFDATAVATNPRARMTPMHRPPQTRVDNSPHCEWLVGIDAEAEALQERDITMAMRDTCLAQLEIERPHSNEPGGMDYYTGPVFEQLQLEQLSQAALVVVCSEIAVQVHLLSSAMMRAVAARYGEDAALAVGEFQMIGSCTVMSHRLAQWLECRDTDIDGVIQVLTLHPAFQPHEYCPLAITRLDDRRALLELAGGPAAQESSPYSWYALLARGMSGGLEALVRGAHRGARIARSDRTNGSLSWEIIIDEEQAAQEEPLAVQIAQGTVLYKTQLQDHIPLLQL